MQGLQQDRLEDYEWEVCLGMITEKEKLLLNLIVYFFKLLMGEGGKRGRLRYELR